jgi:hypothetical protein
VEDAWEERERTGDQTIGDNLSGSDAHSEEGGNNRGNRAQDHDSNEESSTYDFASAHSQPDGPDFDVPTAHDAVAAKLCEQLQGGFHGCSRAHHEDELREHVNAHGNDHHGLDEIFHDPHFPSVLGLSDMITADRLGRQQPPTPQQWREIFCGVSEDGFPRQVCLHREETKAVEPQVAFDIDSFLGFASSLAVARQGLWYQPAPQQRQNIRSDLHIQTHVGSTDPATDEEPAPRSSTAAQPRDLPHFLLGRVEGAHDITIHILFPHLPSRGEKFVSLTQEQHARWLDRVFNPAIHAHCDAHYTQHLPASFRHAWANSKARQVEERLVETGSYQAQQSLAYHLPPERLEAVWGDILDRVDDTPGLQDFRDPQLLFAAKGTKLQFKTNPSRPTLLDALENFRAYFERIMDLDYVYLDRFYVDVGKEICARSSRLAHQPAGVEDEAQVYLWRRCCLQEYLRWLYDGQPPSAKGAGQRFYQQAMLRDAAGLTSLAPKRSWLRAGGLIYSQCYASVKEVIDAAKSYPFQNDGLEELALDPQIRRGARQLSGGRRRQIKTVEQAYCASKRRAHAGLCDSIGKSFGLREEHRIAWPLFESLLRRLLRRRADGEHLEIWLDDCPSYAWAVRTEVFLNYLWRQADKFAAGFEVIRARCREDLVTWEQTKIMAMMLRGLRFALSGHQLSRESALWWSRRDRRGNDQHTGGPARRRHWYGLGFCNTLPRYGYCWIEPRIDWGRLVFKPAFTDDMLFGNDMLRDQYLRRGGQVRDFFDLSRRLELALGWLDRNHHLGPIRSRLLTWIVHICLQQFRIDVLAPIAAEIREPLREEALQGPRGFSLEYFDEIMLNDVYIISGNRCDFKQPSDLTGFLFDFGDGLARRHWEDRPFRKLYQRTQQWLARGDGGPEVRETFQRRFWRILYAYHWLLPYPSHDGLLQTTKRGERMWYSIQRSRAPGGEEAAAWKWARKASQAGHPPAIPEYVGWSKEEWEGWIERRDGRAAVEREGDRNDESD